MNWKRFLLGAIVGYSATIATKKLLDSSGNASPEKVLADVKNTSKKKWKYLWIMDCHEA